MVSAQPEQSPTNSAMGPRQCETHGTYLARRVDLTMGGKVHQRWSQCPTCGDEAKGRKAREERQEQLRKHKRFLTECGVPRRFIDARFEHIVAVTEPQRKALLALKTYCSEFETRREAGEGLVLLGGIGTGKTLSASALLLELELRGLLDVVESQGPPFGAHAMGFYSTALDMIRSIRNTWRRDSKQSESEILERLGTLDLLVIDELGVQYGTDAEQTLLTDLLDRRYRELKPTVLIANLDAAGLEEFIGPRAFDRIVQVSRLVLFDWASHRRGNQSGGGGD